MPRFLRPAALATLLLLPAGCGANGADAPLHPGPWRLAEIGGQPYAGRAWFSFAAPDRIEGFAPCNRFSAPWSRAGGRVGIGPAVATEMACPELALEMRFFETLAAVSTIEATAAEIALTAPDGARLVFRLAPVNGG